MFTLNVPNLQLSPTAVFSIFILDCLPRIRVLRNPVVLLTVKASPTVAVSLG